MRMPEINDFVTVTTKKYAKEGVKLDILHPSEVIVKEKTDDYIIIQSSIELAELSKEGTHSLLDSKNEIRINKGETKKITLAITDYFSACTITY